MLIRFEWQAAVSRCNANHIAAIQRVPQGVRAFGTLNTHCTHLVPTRDYRTHTSLVLERLLPRILGAPARGNDGSQEQGQGYGAFRPMSCRFCPATAAANIGQKVRSKAKGTGHSDPCPAPSVPHQLPQTLAKK